MEYRRATDQGLTNQGWKDSFDAINFVDGRIGEPPIALCEVQGYVYAARLARADLAEAAGDTVTATAQRQQAKELQALFDETFWLPEHGWYALAWTTANAGSTR